MISDKGAANTGPTPSDEQNGERNAAHMLNHARAAAAAANAPDDEDTGRSPEAASITPSAAVHVDDEKRPSRLMSADSYYGYNTGIDERTAHNRDPPPSIEEDGLNAPPAYTESQTLGQVGEKSNDGMGTTATVGDDGRVNIRIDQRSHRLSKLLVPALRQQRQLIAEQGPPPPPYVPPALGGSPGELPPPPMNVVIHVVGSRGDVQPFVALGKVLKDTYQHRVRLATHPVFKDFVQENGLEFFSIGGDPSELMAFMVKNPGLMPGFETLRNGDIGKRRKGIAEMIKGCWRSCIECGDGSGVEASDTAIGDWMTETDPDAIMPATDSTKPFVADAIIANPPSFAHIHCAERLGIPLHMMFTMPWSPTEAFPHPLANIESSNAEQTISNYITYGMVDLLTWQGLGDLINRFRVHDLNLEPVNMFYAPGMLARLKVPYTYCWSPALIPKPSDWGNHISISGFYFLNLASNYTPAPDLKAFLDAGPPPVYIGFGSIVVDDPNAMTKMIFEAIKITGQRALVSKGWGGLGADQLGIPEGVFMLGNVPHDWLFKHVSCVVHHGGAGTTAAGIACGKPTVIVPFFGDQPFWGSMVARAGAGPKPTRYKDLNAQILAESINEALKPESKERAEDMAKTIAQEKGSDVGAQSFHQMLGLDNMRCSLLPEQVAVWRIRRTDIRLSALAAYTLAEKEVITFADLKLYRGHEYEVDSGPTDPISGGAGAIVDVSTAMAMGVADFPIAALKALAIHPDAKKEKKKSKAEEKAVKAEACDNMPRRTGESSGTASRSDQTPESSSRPSISSRASMSSDMTTDTITTPTTASGAVTPKDGIAALTDLQRTMSPEQLSAQSTQILASPAEPHLLSPVSASEVSTTSTSSTSRGRHSAMAQALQNLPEGSRPRSKSGSRTRSGSHRRRDSDSNCPTPKQSLKHWAEQDHESLIDTAFGTGKGISRIVGAGMKSPMDFTLGLSKGFHNLPKLYGEEVRQVDRVTDLKSGLRVAGKELGMGFWDGITGLVSQPISGAKKGGGAGFMKGIGRGIGGLITKPAAGIYGLPGYAMKGIYKEVQQQFGKSVDNYIIAARTAQGWDAWMQLDKDEQLQIVHRYLRLLEAVKRKKIVGEDSVEAVQEFIEQRKEKRRQRWAKFNRKKSEISEDFRHKGQRWQDRVHSGSSSGQAKEHLHPNRGGSISSAFRSSRPPSRPGSSAGKSTSELISVDHRAELTDTQLGRGLPPHMDPGSFHRAQSTGNIRHSTSSSTEKVMSHYLDSDDDDDVHSEHYQHDADFERALRESIATTSKGDADEDRAIDQAIRASIAQLHGQIDRHGERSADNDADDDEQLKRAIEESLKHTTGQSSTLSPLNTNLPPPDVPPKSPKRGISPAPPRSVPQQTVASSSAIPAPDMDDADLKKALAESQQMTEAEEKARREEEIVMEYVKRQSLAEEEFRRRAGASGGEGSGSGGA